MKKSKTTLINVQFSWRGILKADRDILVVEVQRDKAQTSHYTVLFFNEGGRLLREGLF